MQGFAGGRRPKPKVVVSTFDNEDEDVENVTSATESIDLEPPTIPAVKRLNRPQLGKKSSGSKLKLSFGAEEEADDQEIFIPKRSALSKKITDSTKGRKFGLQADSLPTTPSEAAALPARPSYTKDYLNQLRDSTPSTPKDLSRYISEDESLESVKSVESVAGTTSARPAEILDEAVVRALKERRRERARGEDYLSLQEQEGSKPRRRRDSDDEDTYATFVDEPVRLQKNMEAAQQKYKQDQIKEALYQSDSEAMSEVDENEWENQQIAKAQPNLVKPVKRDPHAIPDEIPPVQPYPTVMARLRGQLEAMKSRRAELQEMVMQLDQESQELQDRAEAVQEKLTKAGEEYDLLREEFKATGKNRGLDEVGDFGTSMKPA